MRYGLIGEKLGHSFSSLIHTELTGEPYELCEIPKDKLSAFIKEGNFLGINVTIPYKEAVIPYLDYIDPTAKRIGAVNTVVKKDGRLFGYNTDAYGLKSLIEHIGIKLKGKCVAILGTGGTSKTAKAVVKELGAKEVLTVSRKEKTGTVTYEELAKRGADIEVVINTTPVGMYPSTDASPVDLKDFPHLLGVVDAVYNPLRTELVLSARDNGIPAEGGLFMLAAQGVRASEIFHGKEYPEGTVDRIYKKLLRKIENTVLIGMPSSGKSSVGRVLAELLSREFIDTDELIRERAGMEISEIFEVLGEEHFRSLESEVIREVSKLSGKVIATGGGTVLREENVRALRKCARLFFLDRPLELLRPTADRPLSSDVSKLEKRYRERYPIYSSVCDEKIDGSGSVCRVAELITESLK